MNYFIYLQYHFFSCIAVILNCLVLPYETSIFLTLDHLLYEDKARYDDLGYSRLEFLHVVATHSCFYCLEISYDLQTIVLDMENVE